jgi:hypothetical protein
MDLERGVKQLGSMTKGIGPQANRGTFTRSSVKVKNTSSANPKEETRQKIGEQMQLRITLKSEEAGMHE